MSGTATITTKTVTTPVTVTEVKNGTVMQVTGSSIIVRTDEGFKMFTQGDVDKRGIKIMRHGKPAEVSEFHSGDKLSATIITTMPPKVVSEKEVQATLASSGAVRLPPRLRVRPRLRQRPRLPPDPPRGRESPRRPHRRRCPRPPARCPSSVW